ncbi:DgyrCDS155 [Dimorphilus gyrociliatus]|uniref:DgyrCDS155 n=1 Tax=Dimorphilus gyrociliatus TaxID=2664684 RepID=A0A7I8V596_9ANNE|nr:DgyrCDS155 [Dimorphilus gyrociliatus]
MAHWFHRNPLKASGPVSFDLRSVVSSSDAQKICSDAKLTRARILDLLSNPNNTIDNLEAAAKNYGELLAGFVTDIEDPSADSKLREMILFRWTNTLTGSKPTEKKDSIFELASILFNFALWYTKHAAKIAAKDEPNMEEAKEVHKCLRISAGIFKYIQSELVPKLKEAPEKGEDLENRILNAYIHQSTAEAQEVTIARAIELKHGASLISALAYETSNMYQSAHDSMISLEDPNLLKWKKYLLFKINIYMAYAFNYHGESLLASDKCGEAIKCLQESKKHFDSALNFGQEYSKTKGPGTTCRPHEHLFFRKLGPIVTRTLDKCVRENGFIYHHKVPTTTPALELKATYGLASPQDFEVPGLSSLWTKKAYEGFKIEKHVPDPNENKEKGKDVPPVKEADISQSKKDPGNSSGCVIS